MTQLTLKSRAIAISLAFGLLIASVTAVSAFASVASTVIRNQESSPSMDTYLNVDAGFGSAEITLLANGRYTYGDDGSVATEGTYRLSRKQIVFLEIGPADAACLHLPGVYAWEFDGKRLMLTAVNDPCVTRAYDWASGLWLKVRRHN